MLTDQELQIINQIEFSLKEYALGDIKKSRKQNMLIASFILCFSFINQLSSHRYFGDKKLKQDDQKFREFMRDYFDPKYHLHAEELYIDLRSKLIHNYSANGKFLLSDEQEKSHLQKLADKTFLNVDIFIADVEVAFIKYILHLRTNDEIMRIALNHYNKWKIIA